jgi:ubiquinone/menaquinone biosynthesis C-methylase UbiE
MYPENNLYGLYKKYTREDIYSHRVPDITKKRTLEIMNFAINCCESWGSSLDIGGGSGHYSLPLLHKFKKSVVVEVAPHKELSLLKDAYSNFEYYNNFIEDIDFKEKFDFILLADIFEHIVDIKLFISQISSLQNKGGVVYVLTPNPLFCGPAEESALYYPLNKDGHRKHYLSNEVVDIMNEYGYSLTYSSQEEGPLRQKTKRILRGFSRRDKNLSEKFYIYRSMVAPLLSFFYNPILFFIESYVYSDECDCKNNLEKTLSSTYIFKKK